MEIVQGLSLVQFQMTTSTSTSSSSYRPTNTNIHPNKINFIEGVDLIFNGWTALSLAVQMEFAGEDTQEKARWLRKVIVDHFDAEGKKVEPEDLEDILLDVMVREFYVNLEDFSEREIARLLFDLFRECIRGEVKLLNQLRMKAESMKGKDIISQSEGVNGVEEVDPSLLDPEYINDYMLEECDSDEDDEMEE